jgi:hypothetical protein
MMACPLRWFPVVQIVCSANYYALEGDMCLPCPLGGACAGFVNGNYTLPVPTAGWYNMNATLTDVRSSRLVYAFAHRARA